jgi:hypothetical protein
MHSLATIAEVPIFMKFLRCMVPITKLPAATASEGPVPLISILWCNEERSYTLRIQIVDNKNYTESSGFVPGTVHRVSDRLNA